MIACRSTPPAHRHPDDPSPHRTGDRALAADDRRTGANWSNWWIAAATIRSGSATTSRSPCRSSIRCCNSRRPRWSSRRLTLGTSVYLLPLRHPAPVAKQVATLDHLTEGRLIFGVGVGGEFPREYEVCGVPRDERGARLSEGIALLRQFWSGEPVSHTGRFYGPFTDVPMQPPARQAAVRRSGAAAVPMAHCDAPDGWPTAGCPMSSHPRCTAPRWRRSTRRRARRDASVTRFGTGHLLFTRIDDSYEQALDAATETLSVRYAMDFRRAAQRYCALGRPEQVAERIREFHAAGVRHVHARPARAVRAAPRSDRALRRRGDAAAARSDRSLTAEERHEPERAT